MQTKQFEEPRALSLQEMEETNGGGYSAICYWSVGGAYAGFLYAAATLAGPIGGAIAIGSLIIAAVGCDLQ